MFASELIRQELVAAKEKDITIIASMGNVAASGGYWISANAHEIWASHNTITGSIGIFGIMPTINRALDKIGINSGGVKTSSIDLSTVLESSSVDIERPEVNIIASRITERLASFIENNSPRKFGFRVYSIC